MITMHIAYGPTAPITTAWFDTIAEARNFGASLRAAGLHAHAVVGKRVLFAATGRNDSDHVVGHRSRAAARAVESAERAEAPTGITFTLTRDGSTSEMVTGNGVEVAEMFSAARRAGARGVRITSELGQEVSPNFARRLATATNDELRADYADMSRSYRFNEESGASDTNLAAMLADMLTVTRVLAYRAENYPAPGVRQ